MMYENIFKKIWYRRLYIFESEKQKLKIENSQKICVTVKIGAVIT